jgi:orotidine-5'-phosphate decarboxylase
VSPIFVAIDTRDLERARQIAGAVAGVAGGLKLGLEFFAANGPSGVAALAEYKLPVFLDLKLHDIPNTVAKAVEALAPLRPAVLTVHAGGGQAMLEAAKAAAPEGTRVVAVTVLTSLDETDLADAGVAGSPADQVARLAALARSSGIDGIVCSGAEVAAAREAWPDGFFVVPGVRPEGSDTADQKRVVTPRAALADGASILVIGRPITGASDPGEAIRAIDASLSTAGQELAERPTGSAADTALMRSR